MGRRQTLLMLCQSLMAIAVLTIIVVFWYGAFFNKKTHLDNNEGIFPNAKSQRGEPQRIQHQGHTYWAIEFTQEQTDFLSSLSNTQVATQSACEITGLCILLADTTQRGVDIAFSLSRPKNLPATLPWMGGFINPVTSSVYDLAGRAYLFPPYFSNPGQSQKNTVALQVANQQDFE